MKAFLIDPETQTIEVIVVPADDYARICKLIGCDSLTVGGTLPNRDAVFVDEAGLMGSGEKHVFRLSGQPYPLAGRGVVVGTDAVGESVDVSTKLEALKELVTFESPTALRLPYSAWYVAAQ